MVGRTWNFQIVSQYEYTHSLEQGSSTGKPLIKNRGVLKTTTLILYINFYLLPLHLINSSDMKARYIRTSSISQNEARQLARQNPDEVVYLDKISGAIPFSERPQARKLLQDIADGKIEMVSTSSIDRLGRNTINILSTIETFHKAGVTLKVDNLGLESLINGKENPTFKLIVSVLANISELERASLRERQLEGIAEAKKRGTYKGREKGTTIDKEVILQKYKEVVRLLKMKKSLRDVASRCEVSLGTVQKVKALLKQD